VAVLAAVAAMAAEATRSFSVCSSCPVPVAAVRDLRPPYTLGVIN